MLTTGRRIPGVSDKQVKELGIDVAPWHPETQLRKADAIYQNQTAFRDLFAAQLVNGDEQRQVSGQNQDSGLKTAHKMMGILVNR